MSLVINHNSMSANVARNLNSHYAKLGISTQRLSTGQRVNSAADDAAGLAIRELQRSDIAALHQGARNANDAISLIQVADGSLSVIDEKLIRMRELAEQAATGTYSSTQRLMIESEYQQMASEISRIANSTDFNGIKLLDGTLSGTHDGSNMVSKGALKVHFGTGNDSAEDYYYITIGNCTAEALGVGSNAFEWGRKPIEMTQEAYEKLRDDSAKKVYEKAYAEKFDDYYKQIYAKLTTGTPENPGGVGLPADVASAQAEVEARELAEKAATQDMNMFKAAADKVYEDSYSPAYRDAYLAAIAEGKSYEEADKIASKAGEEAAITAVSTIFESATGGSLTSQMTFFETSAKEAIYNDLYGRVRAGALAAAVAANGGVNLNTAQTQEFETKLKASLEASAANIAKNMRLDLEKIYYDAEAQTEGSGMDAVHDALAAASRGTAFPNGSLTEASYQTITIPRFTLQNANGTPGMIVVPEQTNLNAAANQDNINALYRTVGGKAAGTEYWPPKNREGADLLIDRINQVAYEVIYDRIYNGVDNTGGLFQQAVTNAQANIGAPLNTEQILTIHKAVDKIADENARTLAQRVSDGLQRVYSLSYEANFNTYYTDYIQKGYPHKVAQYMAETDASRDGWTDMQTALNDAQNAGTPFQDNTAPNGFFITDAELQAIQLTPADVNNLTTATVSVANMTVGTLYTQVQRGTPPVDIKGIGDLGNDYLDDHGLLGKAENAIDGALHYVDVFNNGEEAWVPTKGNNLLTQENAQHAITAINSAIEAKDKIRAHLGALQNRFENTITNLNIQAENLQNAESRISDVDVATEMTEFVRQQILTQTAVAMLAQANSLPQMASQLIGG